MNSKQRRKAIRLTNKIIILDNAIDSLGSYYKLDEVQRKEHYELIKEYLKLDKKLKGKRYFKNSYFAEEIDIKFVDNQFDNEVDYFDGGEVQFVIKKDNK